MSYILPMISRLMKALVESRFGLYTRSRVSNWLGYQQVPQPGSLDFLKLKSRVLLSLFSDTVRMDHIVRGRLKLTRRLRATEFGEVLLVGNGPSSLSLMPEQIKRFQSSGGKIAVMNSFFKSGLSQMFEPDYYFIGDPELWSPTKEDSRSFQSEFQNYLEGLSTPCWIMQPAHQPPILPRHKYYIFGDGRSIAGLFRFARPDRPWGLPASIAMVAISTLQFLGYSRIYFTGLDSNMHNYFFVGHKNEILHDTNGYYSYTQDVKRQDRQEPDSLGVLRMTAEPIRHMADLLYAQGIFLRDLYWLCSDSCINIGNDESNDSAPRACLLH